MPHYSSKRQVVNVTDGGFNYQVMTVAAMVVVVAVVVKDLGLAAIRLLTIKVQATVLAKDWGLVAEDQAKVTQLQITVEYHDLVND